MATSSSLSASSASMAGVSGDSDAASAIQKYGAFVEDVLKPQLQASLVQRDAIAAEIREYDELLVFIREQRSAAAGAPLATLLDVGQRFHVRAKITDTTMVTVDIGLNFHAEMTLAEAQAFVEKHLAFLEEKRRRSQEKAREVSTHVNVVLEAIQKLAALQQPLLR